MNLIKSYSIFTIITSILLVSCNNYSFKEIENIDALPEIFPDYTNIVIPPNIAPLNFIIKEDASRYLVKFNSDYQFVFSIKSKTPEIEIPMNKWRELMENSIGGKIRIEIFVRDSNNIWKSFKSIENMISKDSIDPYIAYRRINTGMILWDDMAIVQRNLQGFNESDIISNQNTKNSCIHCHTFQNRDPNKMILQMRRSPSGTLIKTKEKTLWLSTKTPYTLSAFVYPAWHPNGRLIAFSTNKIHQNFFGHGSRNNHVRDDASDIVIYDIFNNIVFTTPDIATNDFENLPAWSPDGKYLYYIKADQKFKYLPDSLEKYDLMRIMFDQESKEWGKPEMLVSSEKTGLSISFPQVSPDGKYVIFCMADYGYFTINNTSSDLYILDIVNNTITKLPVNSSQTESFPSWSDNGRWILFASKSFDGMFTLPFFSYIDSTGTAHKPFVIPFKDPSAYLTRMTNMNRPVFLIGKVNYTQQELLEIAYSSTEEVVFDSINVDINAIAGATANKNSLDDETSTLYKNN